jgi:hypothetical protein
VFPVLWAGPGAPSDKLQRLKLKCDEPLSDVAFKFNLRRYTTASTQAERIAAWSGPRGSVGVPAGSVGPGKPKTRPRPYSALGRAVQVDSIKTRVESAFGVCKQRLKLKYDKLLSSFAFKFNLRHYASASPARDWPTTPTTNHQPITVTAGGHRGRRPTPRGAARRGGGPSRPPRRLVEEEVEVEEEGDGRRGCLRRPPR